MKYLKLKLIIFGIFILVMFPALGINWSLSRYEARAIFIPKSNDGITILYSSLKIDKIKNSKVINRFFGLTQQVSAIPDSGFNNHKKELYLSPDRKLLAVTVSPYDVHGSIQTYITDIGGNKITSAYLGSFISWSPDSQKVLLYRSNIDNERGREIHILDINNNYRNSNLPVGVISADISPVNGIIVYSLTDNNTDHSNIWLRDQSGKDKLIFETANDILAWVRWSPDGSKIAFLRSNLNAQDSETAREIWIMNHDGTSPRKITGRIVWSYPPVWSPDGKKILLIVQENRTERENSIWTDFNKLESDLFEYDVIKNSLYQKTALKNKRVLHPQYSSDGTSAIFVANESGADEVWALKGDKLLQLTDDGEQKRYPIMP